MARISTAGAQVGLLALVARVAGAAPGAEFVLALAVTAPFFLLADLGLRTVYITMRPRVSLVSCLLLRSMTAAGAVLVGAAVSSLAYPRLDSSLVAAVVWIKTADLLLDLFYAPLQEAGRGVDVFACSVLNGLLSLGLTSALLLGGHSIGVALMGSALGSTVVLGLGILRVRPLVTWAHPTAMRQEVRRLLSPGLSMGTAMSVAGLAVFVPQYVLEARGRDAELLVFVLVSYGVAACQLLVQGVTQAAVVDLRARLDLASSRAVIVGAGRRLLKLTTAVTGTATPCLLTLPWLLPRLLGQEYQVSAAEVLPLALSIAAVPAMAWASAMLSALNAYRMLWISNLSGTVVVLIMALLLIPVWPLGGAILCVGLGFLTRALMANWLAARQS